MQRLNECLQTSTVGKDVIDETLAELRTFEKIEALDRDTTDLLVDKIIVYGEQQIEIVWADKY